MLKTAKKHKVRNQNENICTLNKIYVTNSEATEKKQ